MNFCLLIYLYVKKLLMQNNLTFLFHPQIWISPAALQVYSMWRKMAATASPGQRQRICARLLTAACPPWLRWSRPWRRGLRPAGKRPAPVPALGEPGSRGWGWELQVSSLTAEPQEWAPPINLATSLWNRYGHWNLKSAWNAFVNHPWEVQRSH